MTLLSSCQPIVSKPHETELTSRKTRRRRPVIWPWVSHTITGLRSVMLLSHFPFLFQWLSGFFALLCFYSTRNDVGVDLPLAQSLRHMAIFLRHPFPVTVRSNPQIAFNIYWWGGNMNVPSISMLHWYKHVCTRALTPSCTKTFVMAAATT